MHRPLYKLLLLALISLGGCHLIFPYEDRPPDGGKKPSGDAGTVTGDSGQAAAAKCTGVSPTGWRIALIAGSGVSGKKDGPAADATLNQPRAVCQKSGHYLIADWGNDRVRWVSKGNVQTPEDINRNELEVQGPSDLFCTDWASTRVMASKEHRLRVVAMRAPDGTDWLKSTIFGTGQPGDSDGKNPTFRNPMGADKAWWAYYVVADTGNHLVRRVLQIFEGAPYGTTLAGDRNAGSGFMDGEAEKACFNQPSDVAWDAKNERVIIADRGNHRIRFYDKKSNTVGTLAGTGDPGCVDGDANSAHLNWPNSVAVASDGTVFVADTGSNAIRRIKDGKVQTLAGDGLPGKTDPRQAVPQRFRGPFGVSADNPGTVHFADTGNHRVWTLTK